MAKKTAKKKAVRRKVAKKRSASRGKKAAGALRDISVTQLQEELKRRAGSITKLQAHRDTLLTEVAEIEGEISLLSAAIGGTATSSAARPTAKRGRGRPKGSKNKTSAAGALKRTARVGGKRPKNSASLEVALAGVLKGKTMGVTEVAKAVQKAGYKTTSPNFRTIVNQTLLRSDLIKKVSRGAYTAA